MIQSIFCTLECLFELLNAKSMIGPDSISSNKEDELSHIATLLVDIKLAITKLRNCQSTALALS